MKLCLQLEDSAARAIYGHNRLLVFLEASDNNRASVTIEGFVLYAGGDYGLHLNIMLLVQVMAYVMSGTFAIDIVGHWTCTLESGPLIGAPVAPILPAAGIFAAD